MAADRLDPGHEVSVLRVNRDDLPADPDAFDATLVTGPPAGAYDLLPCIGTLIGVLRALDPGKPLVGICFGHRVMAAAFGGRVEKSPKSWGIGLHTYAIHETADWRDGPPQVSVPAIHQDQVVATPPASRTLAGSAFTPTASSPIPSGAPCRSSVIRNSRPTMPAP